jgi:large subunit ribosomal protein L15
MPLIRRIPKRGFHNPFRTEYAILNLKKLGSLEGSAPVTPQRLKEIGLIKSSTMKIKILGDGDLTRPLVIQAHRFSRSAIEKIQKAGGKAEILKGS